MKTSDDYWSQMPEYWRSDTTDVHYEEANTILHGLNIVGRRIKGIYSLDTCYLHCVDDVEEEAYQYYNEQHYSEEDCQKLSHFPSIPPETPMRCCERIDRPLRIQFEDGDILNVDTGYHGFKADLNGIPFPCEKNLWVDLNILFCQCIGKEIIQTECQKLESEYWGEEVGVTFFLSDNSKLVMSIFIDYTEVFHKSANGEIIMIPFDKLKPGLLFEYSEEE